METKHIDETARTNGARPQPRAVSNEVSSHEHTAEPAFSEAGAVREGEIDLLELLIALALRKRLIASATLCGAVLAASISFVIPNRYTAMITILPPQQAQSSAALLMTQLAGSGLGPFAAVAGKDFGLKNPNDIYIGMLKSRTVEDALIGQFELSRVYHEKTMSAVRKDLENASDIVSGKEGLIQVSVEDKSPRRAAALANAYVDELRKLTQRLAVTEASQRRLFFEQQVEQAKSDLAAAELDLKNTELKTGMIHLDAQARAVIDAVGTLRAQIASRVVELQGMRSFATDQNPDVILQERRVAAWRQQLASLEKQPVSSDGDPIVATGKMPAALLEYKARFREARYRENIFELMAKQYEAAKLDEAKEAAIIQVVDPAVEPDKKSSPKRMVLIAVACMCAFLAASIYAVLLHALRQFAQKPTRSLQIASLRESLVGSGHKLATG